MAWDDTKVALNNFASAEWNTMVTYIKAKATVTTGAGTPTATATTPTAKGEIYIDTVALKIYVATATSAPSDFKKVLSE